MLYSRILFFSARPFVNLVEENPSKVDKKIKFSSKNVTEVWCTKKEEIDTRYKLAKRSKPAQQNPRGCNSGLLTPLAQACSGRTIIPHVQSKSLALVQSGEFWSKVRGVQ
eukprot:279250-Rhodomonas_salina.1